MKTILYSLLAAASALVSCQSPPPFPGAAACWTMADAYRPILAKAGDIVRWGLTALLLAGLPACTEKTGPAEPQKALFHFAGGPGWTGEPAALLYEEGTYHLFYQTNPTGELYDNIHWGHAVSADLLAWEILPPSLAPDSQGSLGSGSVIADTANTSGLKTGAQAPFLAFYTYADPQLKHSLGRAYSTDKGATWIKLPPVVLPAPEESAIRSPRVRRNPLSGEWLMTAACGSSAVFYTSPDGKEWKHAAEFTFPSTYGSRWEGVDFFPLRTADGKETKWILTVDMENGPAGGSPATRYFAGDFDGTSFHPAQTKEMWLDYGKDHYAGSTFNGLPDTCRIWLGWMNNWEYAHELPANGIRGQMTFPRRLKLLRDGPHYLVASSPVKALEKYRQDTLAIPAATLSDSHRIEGRIPWPGRPFMLRLTFDNTDDKAIWKARDYGIRLKTESGRSISFGYRNELSYFYIERPARETWLQAGNSGENAGDESHPGSSRAGTSATRFSESFPSGTTPSSGPEMGAVYRPSGSRTGWEILIDRHSAEFFAAGGRIALTALCFPDDVFSSYELFAGSGTARITEGHMITLTNNDLSHPTKHSIP